MSGNLQEDNRRSWNEATKAHNSHKGDQAKFFQEGGSTLHPEEAELLGDLTGLKVAHLLCNSGQDTLSLARAGAIATGVDISDEAIEFARKLSRDTGIAATFHRADVFEWLEQTDERFDLAYSSYGVVHWISDLNRWARGITRILKPGGHFVLVEFHPFTFIFNRDWQHTSGYFPAEAERIDHYEEGVIDYVVRDNQVNRPYTYQKGIENFVNPYQSHTFIWTLGEIVTALGSAGLLVEVLREYPHTIGMRFNRMRQEAHRMLPPEDVPNLPLLYGIRARRIG